MSLEHPVVLFRKGAASCGGVPRTLIVLGAARGGTTMIAQILHDLGVFMGEGLNSTTQDAAMSQISRALFHGQITVDHPLIEQVLRRRDRQFAVWGWKFPTHVFPALYDKARNPHLIFIFRDPVAIATREAVSNGYNVEACFQRALEQTASLGQFLLSNPYPSLSVSYERGLTRKPELVDALADFAGITASPDARQQAACRAQPGTVRYLDETQAAEVEGNIDAVDTHVAGWLRYPHHRNRRVGFAVLVDNRPVHQGVADRFREDLRRAFDNDGCCSFLVPLPDHLRDGKNHRISIRVLNEKNVLINNNDREWTIAGR